MQPRAHGGQRRPLGRLIRREQKHRQHEHDKPERRQRSGDARAFMGRGIEAEQRRKPEQGAAGLWIGGKEAEHHDQAHDAADVADRPAGARQAAHPLRRHQRRHHRVVEHGGEFHADRRDGVSDQQRHDNARIARLAEPKQHGADDKQKAEAGDPGLAPAGRIGDRAEHRRQQRDHEAAGCGRVTPHRLSRHGVRGDIGREVRREHKGRDQREIGLRGPVEEQPADDRRTRRISRSSAGADGIVCARCRGHFRPPHDSPNIAKA